MSHAVESMFYCGEKPWHGLGVAVDQALTSREAIKMAGLDWEVIQVPVYGEISTKDIDGRQGALKQIEIPNQYINVRSIDEKILGIVSKRYQIVQNHEAFEFTDQLLNRNVQYETAGSLFGGKKIWLLARMETDDTVLGEEVDPYLVFTNSHDGSSAVRIAITPVRVVCQNTMNLALNTAERIWSTAHLGNLSHKVEIARDTLDLTNTYLRELNTEAERLYKIKINDEKFSELVTRLIPLPKLHPEQAILKRKTLWETWRVDNISNFRNTGWAVMNAVSDFVTHYRLNPPKEAGKERLFDKVIDGHNMFDQAYVWLRNVG